jgi:hypothetical protein
MWAMILWDAGIRFVGLLVLVGVALLVWAVVLPELARWRTARRRQRQIDAEVDMWLETQRQRAYKAATDELERQLRQRREKRS